MSAMDPTVPIIMFTALNLEGLEKAARNAGPSFPKANVGPYYETLKLPSHNRHDQFSNLDCVPQFPGIPSI